jgi:hypothetical protein
MRYRIVVEDSANRVTLDRDVDDQTPLSNVQLIHELMQNARVGDTISIYAKENT